MDARLREAGPLWVGGLAATGILFTGILDYQTGPELSFSIFYLIPVSTAAWYGGRRPGVGLSALAAAVWLVSDYLSGHHYSVSLILYWNALVRLGFFLITALLLTALRDKIGLAERAARTDPLTDSWNSRGFFELAEREIARTARYGHPFTVAYADLDHFKAVNDARGHAVGDEVLGHVARALRARLRRTDAVGRLGGDEFALLLPETDYATAAPLLDEVRIRAREDLATLGLPLTLSMGAVTFESAPPDVNTMTHLADELMYEVKRAGRDAVRHRRWRAQGGETEDIAGRPARGEG
jgi:diguanylate cyclase (GGDEF)-like protein